MSNGTDYAAKIGKLLAMAEGTDNPHEAEVFMAKAEALMIQQGITEAIARGASGSTVTAEEIVERRFSLYVPEATRTWMPTADRDSHACLGACGDVLPASKFPTTKTRGEREVECRKCRDARYASGEMRTRDTLAYNRAHVEGFFRIARALGLRGYRTGDSIFYAVGFEKDADRTVTLLRSLHMQAVGAMWTWWKVEGSDRNLYRSESDRFKARRDFVFSFYGGAAERIRSERTEQVKATPGAGLAVQDRTVAVEAHMDGMNLRTGRGISMGGSAAGRAAGRVANVGTKATGGGRSALGR